MTEKPRKMTVHELALYLRDLGDRIRSENAKKSLLPQKKENGGRDGN